MAEKEYRYLSDNPTFQEAYSTLRHNYELYKSLKDQNTKLEDTPTILPEIKCSFPDEHSLNPKSTPSQKKDIKLQESINEYVGLFSSCKTEDDIKDVISLITAEEYRQKDLIFGVLAALNRDYRDLEIIVEDEEESDYKNRMFLEELKIELLKKALSGETKIEKEDIGDYPYKIVLAYPSVYYPDIFGEIDDIDPNFYSVLKGLILSYQRYGASYKRHLYFADGSFLEAKSRTGGRVVCTRLSDDTFLVARVFMKTCNKSVKYVDEMERILSDCKNIAEQILPKLDDPEFIEANERNLRELFRILNKEDSSSLDTQKVYEKGGNING